MTKTFSMEYAVYDKYRKYTVSQLIGKAQVKFNKFIRERDKGQPCISCGSYNTATASHFYSAGHYGQLRFNEDNVHLSCVKCNYFLSGNLIEYGIRLEKKIGKERVEKLEMIAMYSKRNRSFKLDRFALIEIIEKYK